MFPKYLKDVKQIKTILYIVIKEWIMNELLYIMNTIYNTANSWRDRIIA